MIDWDTTAQYIDFAIIRCGRGSDLTAQDDTKWAVNTAACERLGIPYGVYLYSLAQTDEEARSEAAHALRLLDGKHPQLPVYLDLEDSGIRVLKMPSAELSRGRGGPRCMSMPLWRDGI